MNAPIDEAARRARVLLIALRGLLDCAAIVEQNTDQIAGAVFLLTELSEAIEQLASFPRPANDANRAGTEV